MKPISNDTEMALFRNLPPSPKATAGHAASIRQRRINLRDSLFPPFGGTRNSFDFLNLAKNCSFLNGELELVRSFLFRFFVALKEKSGKGGCFS
jgi:hypothetical protein